MKGYEAKLTLTWLQMNSRDATAQNLAFIKQYLREGTDFTLDNSTTPATIAYKDTKRVREYAQAQFEARDERDFKIVNGQRVEYGSMRATEATAQANRNQLLGVLMSDASKAFTVKPENRTVEQQELVNFMYSYIAKEAKDAYDTARNEYTAWKNQNPIKEVATYESNNMMLLFGNLTGNQDGYVYSAPPTHLISQAQSGVNFDGINAQALAQGLEGAAITLEKVSTAFSINSTNAALNSTLKITLGSVDDLADGFISAVDDMKNIQKAAEQVLKTAKISRLVGGGVVTLVTTLITSAIEGIVTNVVNKSETERLATYFDKKGPDMSWLNDFSSLDPAKREAAQTKMMLYSAKMMTSY